MAQSRPKPNPRPLRVRNQCQPALIFGVWDKTDTREVTLNLPQYISLNGLPAISFSGGGPALTSATSTTPDQIVLTFNQDIEDNQLIDWAAYDPSVRTRQGGYMAPLQNFNINPV